MKEKLYDLLVNRSPRVRERYRCKRDGGMGRLAGLGYLVWLNLRYGLFTGPQGVLLPDAAVRLPRGGSESSRSVRIPPGQLARQLAGYDVISFDVFDTLLFRPFSDPGDLFELVGLDLDYPGFRRQRIRAEERARQESRESAETREVTLAEIWKILERETGIPQSKGMQTEWERERRCCFANPYLLPAVRALCQMGKTVVAVSDMNLSR